MDPENIVTAIVEIGQISFTISSFFSNNPFLRSRQIYSKLDYERKRTEAWANDVRSINTKKLRETFPPEECDRISDALRELRHSYKRASRKLESVALLNVALLDKDYDDLENLLGELTAANNALQQVAHTPSMHPPRSRGEMAQRWRQLTHESKTADMTRFQDPTRPSFIPPVRNIYRTTHSSLVTISVRRPDPKITRSASRLKLWGAGLFEMALPLDTVFDSNKDAFQPVRQFILRILVDILVWAEQELNKLSNDGQNTERLRDSQSAEQITALLGTDELIPMALESWKDSVDQHKYVQAGYTFNTSYNPVPGLVEILFDLLPALRATRRTYSSRSVEAGTVEDNGTYPLLHEPAAVRNVAVNLDPERTPRHPPSTTQSFSGAQPVFDETYVDSANSKFDQIHEIFKKLDKIAKRESRLAYTSRLLSERECFDRFHNDRRRRKDTDPKDLADVFEKQKQLVQQLSENHILSKWILYEALNMLAQFVTDNAGISNLSIPFVRFRKRQAKGLENYTSRAESFLTYINNTNTAVRNIMDGRIQAVEGSQQ